MDNVFSWAQYILRPKVSQYINQWREENSGIRSLSPLSQLDPTISTILNRVERQLGLLNISDPSGVPGLVQQIITLKEVIAFTSQTTKPAEEVERTQQNKSLNTSIQVNTLHRATLNANTPPSKSFHEQKSVPSGWKESSPSVSACDSGNLTSFTFAASLGSYNNTTTGIDATRQMLEIAEAPKKMLTPVSSTRKTPASDNPLTTENDSQYASAGISEGYVPGVSNFSRSADFGLSYDGGSIKPSTFASFEGTNPTKNKPFKVIEDTKQPEISTPHHGRHPTLDHSSPYKSIFDIAVLRERQRATTSARPVALFDASVSTDPIQNSTINAGVSVSSSEISSPNPKQANGILAGGGVDEVFTKLSWEQLRERSKQDDAQQEHRRRPLRLFHVSRLPDYESTYKTSRYHITVRLPPTDVQYIRQHEPTDFHNLKQVEPVIFGNNSLNFQSFTLQGVETYGRQRPGQERSMESNPVEDEDDWEDIESGNDRPEIVPGHNVGKNGVGAVVTNSAMLTGAKSSVATKPNRILGNKKKRKQSGTSKAAKGVRVHSAPFKRMGLVDKSSMY
jgi:hypothetical protein